MRIAAIALYLRRFLLAWLVSLPLASAPAAASGVDPALLAPLASDDTDARLQAIAALGQLPEPGAAAVLQALGED
ncbi:MAG TPA: urea ABC transporter permease subunit UrtB, partial [Achromobacter sp.]